MSATKVMKMMKDGGVKYVDMRFTDTIGKEQHVTIPAGLVKSDFFKDGFNGKAKTGEFTYCSIDVCAYLT